jgi:hypothetical protein
MKCAFMTSVPFALLALPEASVSYGIFQSSSGFS